MNWLAFGIAVATILSLVSSWISPVKFWYAALLGLAFPYLFLINFLLIVSYILRKKIFFVVPLIAFIITVNHIPLLLQLDGNNGAPEDTSPEDRIKVVSFNVRVFDLYNWTRNIDTRERIFSFLEYEEPDVLCIQEFYSSDKPGYDNLGLLRSRLDMKYHQVEYPITVRGNEYWGIVTLSKYPVVNKGVIYFDEKRGNVCIYTDIDTGKDTIRFYNTHLQSIRFNTEDYKFLENLGADEQGQKPVKRTRAIISRLKNAYVKRSHQAELISSHVNESPYPSVICGDFNDTPISYCYRTLSSGMNDAFRESGSGIGSTYRGPIPALRIDYILHSKGIRSWDFNIHREKLSDHYPVSCSLTGPGTR